MKKNKYNVLSLALLLASVVFTSCNNDDLTNDSVKNANDGVASVVAVSPTIDVNGVSMLNEGTVNSDHKFSVVLDEVQPVDVYVNVSLVPGGDAVEGEDFDFDHQILIPAFTNSGEGTISIHGDDVTESTESFTLMVGSGTEANLVVSKELVFNITDFGDLNLELSWDTTFEFGGSPYTLCEIGYDVDFLLLDSTGEDVTNFDAATGDCPETMTLSLADLPDGEYELIQTVYETAGLETAGLATFEIPVTVTYSRDNSSFAGSFVQDASDASDSDAVSDPSGANPIYVATITVANGMFTFSKNGTFVASGRMNKIEKILKNRKAKAAKANFFQGLK